MSPADQQALQAYLARQEGRADPALASQKNIFQKSWDWVNEHKRGLMIAAASIAAVAVGVHFARGGSFALPRILGGSGLPKTASAALDEVVSLTGPSTIDKLRKIAQLEHDLETRFGGKLLRRSPFRVAYWGHYGDLAQMEAMLKTAKKGLHGDLVRLQKLSHMCEEGAVPRSEASFEEGAKIFLNQLLSKVKGTASEPNFAPDNLLKVLVNNLIPERTAELIFP